MKARYFVFEKDTQRGVNSFLLANNPDSLSELRKYLNTQLKNGFNAEDFVIIYGREKKITAVKVVAELETAET